MTDAWEVFCASIDPVQLETERMRVISDLSGERPGCRRDRQLVWVHERRAVEFWKRADSGSWSPLPDVPDHRRTSPLVPRPVVAKSAPARKSRSVISKSRQLEIAIQALLNAKPATSGPVGQPERVSESNSSTGSSEVIRAAESNISTTNRKAA